ncbi:MAG: translesion error-prone DNA polymerase V autoproteolytic subunit [Cellvibrionales bacterium]|nr:translesion error-prone DNA polymerase V autoproteolytic subunit [Cellvibrionales bacterium]
MKIALLPESFSVSGGIPDPFDSPDKSPFQPLFASRVSAGFPSPADDYVEGGIDLHRHLVKNPAATFFAKASGDSMQLKGIYDGDLLVVDRSLSAKTGDVVIAAIDGELVCKILDLSNRQLVPANPSYPPITLCDEAECLIEGVVTHAIRYL